MQIVTVECGDGFVTIRRKSHVVEHRLGPGESILPGQYYADWDGDSWRLIRRIEGPQDVIGAVMRKIRRGF